MSRLSSPDCLRCRTTMVRGFILDRGNNDASRVARVWGHLYREVLPGLTADPANAPAQERYRAIPDFERNDTWDLDCVVPLSQSPVSNSTGRSD